MMRRRAVVGLLAGVLLAGLVAVPGSPAGAQDLTDLPRLGFEINPTQGNVGDVVDAQVDPDDVQEHCLSVTDLADEDLQGILADFVLLVNNTYRQAVESGERPYPGGLTPEEFQITGLPIVALAFGVLGDPVLLDELWRNLFVLTFVEPATTEMVGPMGSFDPISGEGEIVVPALDPGLYVVAAACVGFKDAEELLAEGGALDQAFPLLHEWIVETYPEGPPPFGFPISDEFVEFVEAAAQVWLPEVVEPQAIGLDFYCILQDDGFCATPPGPVGLIDDEVIDEFNDDEPLAPEPGAEALDEVVDAGDLVAVQATPAFTG